MKNIREHLIFTPFILLAILNVFSLHAQISINGNIYDKITKKPIINAHVGVLGTRLDTSSNNFGNFILRVPESRIDDTLYINVPGYKLSKTQIRLIKENNSPGAFRFFVTPNDELLNSYMSSDSMVAGQQVFQDKSIAGRAILERALEKIEQNFTTEPYVLEGFYREFNKENGKAVRLFEAQIQSYDEGFHVLGKSKLIEKVKLNHMRRSDDHSSEPYLEGNGLEHLFHHNDVRYPRNPSGLFGNLKVMEYRIKELQHDKENLMYVIKFGAKLNREDTSGGVLYIRTDNFIFDSLSYFIRGFDRGQPITIMEVYIKLQEHNGRFYLSYLGDYHRHNNYRLKDIDFYYERSSEFVVTEVYQEKLPIDGSIESEVNRKTDLYNRAYSYDETFWTNYNGPQLLSLDPKIKYDLEINRPLTEQFRDGAKTED